MTRLPRHIPSPERLQKPWRSCASVLREHPSHDPETRVGVCACTMCRAERQGKTSHQRPLYGHVRFSGREAGQTPRLPDWGWGVWLIGSDRASWFTESRYHTVDVFMTKGMDQSSPTFSATRLGAFHVEYTSSLSLHRREQISLQYEQRSQRAQCPLQKKSCLN